MLPIFGLGARQILKDFRYVPRQGGLNRLTFKVMLERQMGLICAVPRRSSTWRPRDYAGPPGGAIKI